jgi:hypothetical protein
VNDVTERFRSLLGRRHFVDRESGVLLVWVGVDDRAELVELVPQVGALHPEARFGVQEAGTAVAVRRSARDQELAELEARYVPPVEA